MEELRLSKPMGVVAVAHNLAMHVQYVHLCEGGGG